MADAGKRVLQSGHAIAPSREVGAGAEGEMREDAAAAAAFEGDAYSGNAAAPRSNPAISSAGSGDAPGDACGPPAPV